MVTLAGNQTALGHKCTVSNANIDGLRKSIRTLTSQQKTTNQELTDFCAKMDKDVADLKATMDKILGMLQNGPFPVASAAATAANRFGSRGLSFGGQPITAAANRFSSQGLNLGGQSTVKADITQRVDS